MIELNEKRINRLSKRQLLWELNHGNNNNVLNKKLEKELNRRFPIRAQWRNRRIID